VAAILDGVVPLFAAILLGFAAGKARLLDEAAVRTLVAFVFTVAMPPLLFRMMARADLAALGDWRLPLTYLAAVLPVFAAGALGGRLLFGMAPGAMTIQGFGSSFSNGVVLGLPLALALYGEAGGVPAMLIITLDVLVFSGVTLLLELTTNRRAAAPGRILLATLRSIARNPIIMATFLGVLWGLAGWPLPAVVDGTLGFVGQAGPPAALFSLGATLSLRRLAGNLGTAGLMVLFKLALHPLLVWLLVTRLVPLDPLAAAVALLFAACPVGANTYVFAQHYRVGIEISASAILLSTALAMATLTGLLLVLPSLVNGPITGPS
jgi:hypothetical protein